KCAWGGRCETVVGSCGSKQSRRSPCDQCQTIESAHQELPPTMIVFTYPGQGSQAPGMGRPWVDHPSWELVHEASEATGRDIESLLREADAEGLRQTRNAQLSRFGLSMVVLDAVERAGVDAAGHAGHSLGEYSALTASGALDFSDAVRLVAE